jgi:AcrR family transcriptional regulator
VPPEAGATSAARPRRLRADALRNRQRLLDAARDAFIEQGPNAPLDDIARRAGVGIGTLYRRFPDRPALLRQVALDLLVRSAHEGGTALAEERDAFAALARYLHRALDLRIAAAMPVLVGQLQMDEDAELMAARDASVEPLERIISTAHADGSLRPDVVSGDIGLLLVRLTRPLPGPFPPEVERGLAHRHLDLLLAGLRTSNPSTVALSGPAMTFQDLRAMPQTATARPLRSKGATHEPDQHRSAAGDPRPRAALGRGRAAR